MKYFPEKSKSALKNPRGGRRDSSRGGGRVGGAPIGAVFSRDGFRGGGYFGQHFSFLYVNIFGQQIFKKRPPPPSPLLETPGFVPVN